MSEETHRKLMAIFAGAFVFTFIVTCAIFLKIYKDSADNGRWEATPRRSTSWHQPKELYDTSKNAKVWVQEHKTLRIHGAFDTRTGRFSR